MPPIIGLDFGNFNTYACFISDFDTGTRIGGVVRDLLPPRLPDGIPSIYFYSKRVGPLLGENAAKSRAVPLENRLRYLKRHLGETTTLDDREISYDDAITQVIQHCVRVANSQLEKGWLETTNLLSLAYPATYTFAQRQRLVELAERATLEDGRKLSVFGTIAEPAAAALDYLSEYAKEDQETTVLTYDLGGGTFDLALVTVYPKGKTNAAGNTYYYDVISTRGLPRVGGSEFDGVLYRLLRSKLAPGTWESMSENERWALWNLVEPTKVELSAADEAFPQLLIDGDYLDVSVTRTEFEAASKELLMQTVLATKEILQDHANQKPKVILLTGGASQMPMVQEALKRELPEYRDKIVYFRPSRAIAFGAARYGTSESNEDPAAAGAGIIQQRVMYDLGVRYFASVDDQVGHILPYIKAGTEIPLYGKFYRSRTLYEKQSYSRFRVYEANKEHPDNMKPDQDWKEIMSVEVSYGSPVPVGTTSESRLNVDKRGIISIEARRTDVPDAPLVESHVQLRNLS